MQRTIVIITSREKERERKKKGIDLIFNAIKII